MPYDKDADVYKPDSRGKPPTGLAGTVAEALFAECKKIWRTAADLRKVFDDEDRFPFVDSAVVEVKQLRVGVVVLAVAR